MVVRMAKAVMDTYRPDLIAQGPVASKRHQDVGHAMAADCFNANSSHPFENPTHTQGNFLSDAFYLHVPAGLTYTLDEDEVPASRLVSVGGDGSAVCMRRNRRPIWAEAKASTATRSRSPREARRSRRQHVG